ncbi:hypothetical protein Tco_1569398 [Tanacetum coccineum]
MVSFRLLHSHLKVLSIKGGFERACVALFDQDNQTFTESLLLNLDNLEKQLDREEFQETESIGAFRSFLEYTRTEIQQFRDTLIQHMEYVKKSINERAQHKRENNRRVNDRVMQPKEGKVDSSKALDAGLVVTESNETESERHVSNSKSEKDTHAEDADINSVNDKQPLAKVQLTVQHDTLANENNILKTVENADLKAQIQEKVFANAALKNELRKLKGNSVDTKFAKPSILGKPVLQPPRNQSVVRQPNAFKSERPNFSKPRFASQVDVNNVLSKPVTQHYLPKGRESAFAKPNHMIASSSSRNSSKNMPRFSSNDMVHNYYLEEAKKKTQERDRKSTTSVMPSAKSQNTTKSCKSKPRSNNQTSRVLPTSKSSCPTTTVMPKADHSRNSSPFSDFKHFVCSTCQKCVFNANHDACITKFLKEVNSRAKIQPNKTRNSNKPVHFAILEMERLRVCFAGRKKSTPMLLMINGSLVDNTSGPVPPQKERPSLLLLGALFQPHRERDISSSFKRNALIRDLIVFGVAGEAKTTSTPTSPTTQAQVTYVSESVSYSKFEAKTFVNEELRKFVGGRLYEGDLRLRQKNHMILSYDVLIIQDCDEIPKRPTMFLNLWRYKVVRHRYSNPMIQPESEGSTQGYPLVSVEVLRFYTSAGNPVKDILLKLNLPDHRIIKDGGEVVSELPSATGTVFSVH